jgi:hypothetical protein
MNYTEAIVGLLVGIGLSAACGLRIFVPLLGISIAAFSGQLELAHGFEWMGTPIALIAFSSALIIEVIGYYIPCVDNLLDVISTPVAVAAGTIMTASLVGHTSPFLNWTLALIAGGGTAALFHSGTSLVRGASTVTTAGTGNPIVSTFELIASVLATIAALIIPIIATTVILLLGVFITLKVLKRIKKKRLESLKFHAV